MSGNKILIVTFTFPPYSGIGGRRWAKFAKYLQKAGNEVEVIAAKSTFDKNSPWQRDIGTLKVSYHDSGYPKYLGIRPKTIIQKLFYRLSLVYVKIAAKGNYYDKSALWGDGIRKAVNKKIKNGIDKVYVTCAPFHLAYHLIPLVKKHSNINWVVDFRDPWTNNRTAYGFESLSHKRQQFEIQAEKLVVESYDEVISVAEPMTDYFRTLKPNNPQKFKTIFNGFDPEDFPAKGNSQESYKLKFVFAGNLYDKAIPSFKLFSKAVNDLEVLSPNLFSKLQFTFIGVEPNKLNSLNHPSLEVLPYLPFEKVRDYLFKADVGMLFLTPDIDWSFSTKFTDYLGAKLKILVVSETESETGNYCIENKLGFSYFSNCEFTMIDIINHLTSYKPKNETFNYSRFSVDKLANRLL